jgi:hypothetical protein
VFEFAANTFRSFMLEFPAFRPVPIDQPMAGGSLVLGQDVQSFSDGRTTITFSSSADRMQLMAQRPGHPVINREYLEFSDVIDEARRIMRLP